MGGSTGNGLSFNLSALESSAKQKLREAASPSATHVFISFSAEDINEVNLLRGQAKNENSELAFDDYSVKKAYNSEDADYIKRQIRDKIDKASVTVVFLSPNAATSEWVNWEIAESIKRGKGVVGVYSGSSAPAAVPSAFHENGCKAVPWKHDDLNRAITDTKKKR
jgi:MTH538 TIR-like domain (DUF1863)